MDFDKCGGGNKRGGWNTKMDFDKCGGGFFCGGWNFSKSVSVGSTFIREMRVELPTTKCSIVFTKL